MRGIPGLMTWLELASVVVILPLTGCADRISSFEDTSDAEAPSAQAFSGGALPGGASIALTDLGTRTYLGFTGGLYPNGSNMMPAGHAARGMAQAALIRPLDTRGQPSATGKYVLLSIGHSSTTQIFCAFAGTRCNPWSFAGQAAADPAVNRTTLAIVNGARGGQDASAWVAPTSANYELIRTQALAPAGLSEAQVQIVWLKTANAFPTTSLPGAAADARILTQRIGAIARTLKKRYPNLRQIFVSSRTYGGFTDVGNPEPFAYESGFATKWVVEAQIRQLDGGAIDPRAGDLGPAAAPWLAWGAYLWAGTAAQPRRDGFFWSRSDFEADGIHPSTSGETKAGGMLLRFFKSAPQTSCWFLAGRTC